MRLRVSDRGQPLFFDWMQDEGMQDSHPSKLNSKKLKNTTFYYLVAVLGEILGIGSLLWMSRKSLPVSRWKFRSPEDVWMSPKLERVGTQC